MRKFSLQLLGLLIIYVALRLVAERTPALYVLRDGGLLALAGMLVFAFHALSLWTPLPPAVFYHWTLAGRTLFLAGCLTALSGGLLYLLPDAGSARLAMQATLWFLGMGMMLAGAVWHGAPRDYRGPSYRWAVDEAGAPVRLPLDAPPATRVTPFHLSRTAIMTLALLIILLGVFLRLWRLTTLPASCVQAECVLGLRLLEPGLALLEGNPLDPFGWLTRLFFTLSGDGVASLRLAGAVIGILTLPVFFGAAIQVSDAGGALLATLLLALHPWHLLAARSGESRLFFTLLLSVALWAAVRALADHRRGWWLVSGLATGALCLSLPALRPAIWLWAVTVVIQGTIFIGHDRRSRLGGLALYAAGVVVTSLPILAIPLTPLPEAAGFRSSLTTVVAMLEAGRPAPDGISLLAIGTLACSLGGVAALVRWWRRPTACLLLSNLLILGGGLLLQTPAADSGEIRLVLLPGLLLGAAVALDQLVRTFSTAWAPVLRPAIVLGAALAFTALLGGRNLLALDDALRSEATDPRNPAYTAMASYVAETLAAAEAGAPLLYVPPALFELPAARLALGTALESGRVQPLEDIMTLFSSATGGRAVELLLTAEEQGVRELLTLLLPEAVAAPIYNDEGRLLFLSYRLAPDALAARRGLAGAYFAGPDQDELITDRRDGPLIFDWRDPAELAAPFRVRWTGSLLVPEAGLYGFSVEGADVLGTRFSLLLDDRLVLDSTLDMRTQRETLARGAYRIAMEYSATAAEPPPLVVTWTPPSGQTEPIPRSVLASPALPDVGLLAAYFEDDSFRGPAVDLRKDLSVGTTPLAAGVAAVEWQGKLAANRAGEYLLAIVADGDYQLTLDSRTVIDSWREISDPELDAYREALLYLEPGWHDLTVRYVPAAPGAALRLLWQPPGAEPSLLSPAYLTPYTGTLEVVDRALPAAPPLVDPILGDDAFALSRAAAERSPQTIVLPAALASLPLTPVWRSAGGCGAGESQLNRPHGVVIDADAERIYVADTGNRRVVGYTFASEVAAVIADARLEELTDLAREADGPLLALDAGSQQIYRIDPAGATVEPRVLASGFYRPRGFDVDASGTLFVADTGGGRVAVLEPGGALLNQFGGPGTPLGIGQPVDTLATATALWGVTSEDGRLWNLYADGSLAVIGRAVSLDGPHLAGLSDGSFFLSDPAGQRILYLTAQGRPVQEFSQQGAFDLPTGIAVAELAGEVYLAVVDTQRCDLSLWRGPRALLQ